MAWRDKLRKASFRDVPFEVVDDSNKGGRRTQTHEFPQRDEPYTEDLGRATREFNVTAFVIGDDYMARRDALIAALEKAGPGTLAHPWLGNRQVQPRDFSYSHSLTTGGMCEFQLVFVEAGELVFPAAADSPGAQVMLAADQVTAAAEADFLSSYKVDGLPAFVLDGAVADLEGYVDTASKALGGMSQVLANPLDYLLDAAGTPSTLVSRVRGLYGRANSVLTVAGGLVSVFGGGGVHARNRNAVLALAGLGSTFGKSVVPASAQAPATRQQEVNRAATAALLQRATLVQAAGMASAMSLPVFDDAVQIRTSLLAALDDASTAAPDAVYDALQQLRARVHTDITARLASAARLVTVTPREVQPALVLAYDRYEDPARDQEIVERNAIRHPGFVPAEPLRLLAS